MKKLSYEPPLARDLSGLGASGRVVPYYQCANGLVAQQEPGDACTGGGQAAASCAPGLFYEAVTPTCVPGGAASECIVGSAPTVGSICSSGTSVT